MDVDELVAEIRSELVPEPLEAERIRSLAKRVLATGIDQASQLGMSARPVLVGSVAKGTWLPGARDVDVFLLFPQELSREALREHGLALGQAVVGALGGTATVAYAEHPYVKGEVDGFAVDLVPAYQVDAATKKVSSVGRTPFHTKFVCGRISESQRGEVRLLKRFCTGCDLYGADTRTQGLSGYLCELLVLHYGSFIDVLEAVAVWEPPVIIDIEDHRDEGIRFSEPVLVIDPVDPRRNVAAALSSENLHIFSLAARDFLGKPNRQFFFPSPIPDMTWEDLPGKLSGDRLVLVTFEPPDVVPDQLWPQLRRFARSLLTQAEREGFVVRAQEVWSDEDKLAVVALRVSTYRLAPTRVHHGPLLDAPEHHQKAFLEKHRAFSPRIHNRRWEVVLPREHTLVDTFIEGAVITDERGLVRAGCPRGLASTVATSGSMVTEGALEETFTGNDGLRRFLNGWLSHRRRWEWG
ncbi:MAG: CCA tRNA nucleotidyltransferase [Candidatus Undinarchaeales archaeon]|nr:CCA tRNA nucleotidyltransferase [Candidatus Undinarchaeales archaeon]